MQQDGCPKLLFGQPRFLLDFDLTRFQDKTAKDGLDLPGFPASQEIGKRTILPNSKYFLVRKNDLLAYKFLKRSFVGI